MDRCYNVTFDEKLSSPNITFKNLGTPIKLTVKELNVSVHYIILENISLFYTT